ncbi:PadR family transcriptional regulator [Anaeromicropila herbilytica]|uniref:PadR family transcriptional regulator n=1 Tax=Anaeromicropila herbilytica TaxID=2785025 RepID=A0A7R7EIT7_9FIRM|nr:PadR family transcriptional regulator [Anaeromicropila herbilytica]BCN29489.1 PadR family transcriptional regulator [Anaeromicropila herbilytica]
MIRGLILFYLNIKPTHGYEIQKFLQMSGSDQWAKIQSGSIYYALTKLEKEKFIEVHKEERTGSRVRKIYQITESGIEEMRRELKEELAKPIANVGSFKFMTYPITGTLSKEEMKVITRAHIKDLEEQLTYWTKWKDIKTKEENRDLEYLSFRMTINSLNDQIEWHKELLNHMDQYIALGESAKTYIRSNDFSEISDEMMDTNGDDRLQYLEKLKGEILKDPDNAVQNIDKIIDELKKQRK